MHFIRSLILFGLGFLLVKYREQIQRFTGEMAFAEKWFGVGGTFTLILLVGVLFMIFSIFYLTGVYDDVINATVGRLFMTSGK